jgi:phage terminase small subunit
MGKDGQLTTRQRRAIDALLTSRNVTDAAYKAHVSRRTLTGWLALPHFQAELKAASAEVVDATIRRLSDATGTAVDVLTGAMLSVLSAESVKVNAANIVLQRLYDLKTIGDFEQRLAALEERKDATASE